MPTGEETEAALMAMEGVFPNEVGVVRKRLAEISEERPMHAWLREVVEAIHLSVSATNQMRETIDRLIPGISETSKFVASIYEEERKRTKIALDDQAQKHALELHEADTWRSFVDGGVTMANTTVKHPAFWSAVTAFVTWIAMTYGIPLPEIIP